MYLSLERFSPTGSFLARNGASRSSSTRVDAMSSSPAKLSRRPSRVRLSEISKFCGGAIQSPESESHACERGKSTLRVEKQQHGSVPVRKFASGARQQSRRLAS